MLRIFENSTLYKIEENQVQKQLHENVINAELLILLKMDIAFEPELGEMLHKMVAALGLPITAVEFLLFKDRINLQELAKQYQAKHLVCFGAEPEDLSINMQLNLYQQYVMQDFSLLLANDILDIYNNQNLKGKLWNELKRIKK